MRRCQSPQQKWIEIKTKRKTKRILKCWFIHCYDHHKVNQLKRWKFKFIVSFACFIFFKFTIAAHDERKAIALCGHDVKSICIFFFFVSKQVKINNTKTTTIIFFEKTHEMFFFLSEKKPRLVIRCYGASRALFGREKITKCHIWIRCDFSTFGLRA